MAAADAWGRSMHDDPLLTWLTGGSCPDKVSRFFRAFAAMCLRASHDLTDCWVLRLGDAPPPGLGDAPPGRDAGKPAGASGVAETPSAKEPAAVCIGWRYPDSFPSDWAMLRGGAFRMIFSAPCLTTWTVYGMLVARFEIEKIKFHRAHGPFYHIVVFGTVPESQGQGLGSELLQKALQRADQLGIPAYLESNGDRSAAFYARNGFEVLQQMSPARGAPSYYRMARWPKGWAGKPVQGQGQQGQGEGQQRRGQGQGQASGAAAAKPVGAPGAHAAASPEAA
ncbi:hypothetical protein HYH03_004817 [Edaphochlamys debaryana]|uniref:N-acetyltransferase domain-containing protein n=1 Tax=Edaphochlamys debaryana TaxID=47281 RepID=A0A835Y9H7_9CHLO|nr:hypothetical protein HYH03_004817 [Edaphochlamys debaryana]|eukprot:KAG2497228.1 hypothetical protein HYH03_004817 [Edaphochlamys debaryana]